VKTRLAAGETLLGAFLALGSPVAAEVLGHTGLDWLLVDLEHGAGDEAAALAQLVAAQSAGVAALVRVESGVRERTTRMLDLGADGIMCPRLDSAAEATAWARALRHPPAGTRGIARGTRAVRYGLAAGANVLGIAQVESAGAVAEARDIAAIDAVDVLFVGPADLAHELGCARDFADPALERALRSVVAAAASQAKAAGVFCATADEVAAARALGFRMIGVGTDAGLLAAGARAVR
jgi:2-keto-3-deoxy-L-rhamnonate aldolase RhmA